MDTYRLLDETCQMALDLLGCDLAWLLGVEGDTLHSRALACAKGESAAEVFLWRLDGHAPQHPTLPLQALDNALAALLLKSDPIFNLPTEKLHQAPNGVRLARAFRQLRLSYLHALPLQADESPVGILILATDSPAAAESWQQARLIKVLMAQAATALENLRLIGSIAVREEQIRADQAFLKRVLDTMGDGLLVLDEEACVQYVNNRMLLMSGYTREELYGNSVGALFHVSTRDLLVQNLRRGGRGTVNFSQQLVTRSGRIVPVLMSRATTSADGKENTILVLSDLTEQKRREQALERQGERLRALNRAVQALNAALDQENVIDLLLRAAREMTDCEHANLFLQDAAQADIFYVVTEQSLREGSPSPSVVRLGQSVAGRAAAERRSQLSLAPATADFTTQPPAERFAVLAVPLIMADQLIGVLEVLSLPENGFSRDDVEFLENLASAGAAAIEKARLYEEAQRHVRELGTLLETSAAVSSTLDINGVLSLVTRRLREALGAARCAIATWDETHNQLAMLAEACDAFWQLGSGAERPYARLLFEQSAARGKLPPSITAQHNDPNLMPIQRDHLTRMGMASLLIMPLHLNANVRGMVELYQTYNEPPFEADQVQAAEKVLSNWHLHAIRSSNHGWLDYSRLTQLVHSLLEATNAQWCILSHYDAQAQVAYTVREIGFALRERQVAFTYDLAAFPSMAHSLQEGVPTLLNAATLRHDSNERTLMANVGAHSGLLTPLMVRGNAIGLVKLLDVQADRVFEMADISLAQAIANVIANALENAALYQAQERRAAALQRAYDDLREADHLKDNLLQSLSHELKTPLHKIMMQVQILDDEMYGSLTDEQHTSLRSVLGWSAQLASIVDEIVIVHALNAEDLHFSPVQLAELTTQAVRKVRLLAGELQLEIGVDVPEMLPAVRGDATHLLTVLEQLINNAVKFSPEGGRIEVSGWQSSPHAVRLCVQDHGIGIPEEQYERIFQRGYQVESGITRRFGGVGLGLAVVRRIVEAHNGQVWVESVVGEGSRFYVQLPIWT